MSSLLSVLPPRERALWFAGRRKEVELPLLAGTGAFAPGSTSSLLGEDARRDESGFGL